MTEGTRQAVLAWVGARALRPGDYLFPSRVRSAGHLSTLQYARIVHQWVEQIGLDGNAYGTHTMRRTKASLIYRRTKNLRAVQLLLGHPHALADRYTKALARAGRNGDLIAFAERYFREFGEPTNRTEEALKKRMEKARDKVAVG